MRAGLVALLLWVALAQHDADTAALKHRARALHNAAQRAADAIVAEFDGDGELLERVRKPL